MTTATELNMQKAMAMMKALEAGKDLGRHTLKLKTQEPVNVVAHLEPERGAAEEGGQKTVSILPQISDVSAILPLY